MIQMEGYIGAKQRSGFYVESLGVQQPRAAQPLKPKHAPLAENAHRTPLVDFKANRTSLELFPKTVWNQLMRKTLLEGDKLYETAPSIPTMSKARWRAYPSCSAIQHILPRPKRRIGTQKK